MKLNKTVMALAFSAALTGSAFAAEDHEDNRIPRLDHAFVIVMENHTYDQVMASTIIKNYAATANLARNYYAVGHPSLTNYLEIVGGSNFGVVNDNSPDWHNVACASDPTRNSLVTAQLEGTANTCPIGGSGYDAATPNVDSTNEGTTSVPVNNCYVLPCDANTNFIDPAATVGKTIADQLVENGMSWKSYQENLPAFGGDRVNWSDGLLTNATPAPVYGVPHLYAVKHNPFAYFANVQAGTDANNSMKNIVGFEQLYADLAKGDVPNYSLIAPNQCHDQHGRGTGEVGPGCSDDAGTLAQGDASVIALVSAIKASPAWKHGHNAIVVVWDENDYSGASNKVVTIVDTNYGVKGTTSDKLYNHFSLLKTLEAGFGLDYLNHAADPGTALMSDLFAAH